MFGKLTNSTLQSSYLHLDGYKPIVHEPIPIDFDQQSQYAYELEPVETETEIIICVGIGILQNDDLEV